MADIIKNKNYTVRITDYTDEGLGVGKDEESFLTLFVKDTAIGDKVEAKVLKAKKTYGYAKMISLMEASPDRKDPGCAVFDKCGGCQLRHISYEAQLTWKEKRVADVLERVGGLKAGEDFKMLPIIGMENPLRYRNKAQYPVGIKDRKAVTGFFAERSHRVIPTEDCLIEHAQNASILETIRRYLNDNNVPVYDEETHDGLVRHVLIRTAFSSGDIMVCLVLNCDEGDEREFKILDGLADELKKNENIKSFVYNFNNKKTNVIMGRTEKTVFGDHFITEYIGDVGFHISPGSFFQVNPVQTKVLYEKACEYAGLTGKETVWDLYCGIGTISLFLSGKAGQVYGVEVYGQAVENAKENAKINNIDNATFICSKAEDIRIGKDLPAPDVILVDPPRKGCDAKLLETIAEASPRRLVYVSCNPATLARDVKVLTEAGFVLKEVQPVDMFPETTGVETVALLSGPQATPG